MHLLEPKLLQPNYLQERKKRMAVSPSMTSNTLNLETSQNTLQQKINHLEKYKKPDIMEKKRFSMTYESMSPFDRDRY